MKNRQMPEKGRRERARGADLTDHGDVDEPALTTVGSPSVGSTVACRSVRDTVHWHECRGGVLDAISRVMDKTPPLLAVYAI